MTCLGILWHLSMGGWTGGAGVRGERGREAGGEGEGSGERGGGKRGEGRGERGGGKRGERGGGKQGERGREAGIEGEGSGERGREAGIGYPPVHPHIYVLCLVIFHYTHL